MKKINPGFLWAGFFVLIGVFLLLSNLNVLGPWGDAIWGGLFVAAGLAFLASFVKDRLHRWEAVAGTTLISGGAVILLEWRNVALGDWTLGIVLLGLALGFWLVAIFRREDWWAILPAGVLTLEGLLLGLGRDLPPLTFNALFLMGLGGVFGLIYLLRLRYGDRAMGAGAGGGLCAAGAGVAGRGGRGVAGLDAVVAGLAHRRRVDFGLRRLFTAQATGGGDCRQAGSDGNAGACSRSGAGHVTR